MKATTKRYLAWGAMGLILLVLLMVAFAPQPTPVDVTEIRRGPLRVTVSEEGETRVRDRFTVSAPVAGQVLRIELEPGDPVAAGETVLATFAPSDPSPLDVRSRREAEARAKAAREAVRQAQAERERAASEAEYAETELRRTQRLAEQGIVSEEELDLARTRARTTREALRSAEFALSTARYELEHARAVLSTDTDGDGEVITLTSPVDGVVLERFRESAAVVAAGEPLLEVADTGRLEIVSDFLSQDAVKIDPGQRALIEHWGGEETLEARVRRVEPSGFTKISALGVEEQRVNVILDFVDPQTAWGKLGDGYRVEVAVILWEGDDVLQVPTSALFRHRVEGEDRWAVFRVVDEQAVLTPVEVGHRTALAAEVISGPSEGDTVIVHPNETILDGTKVEPRQVR